MYKRSIASLVSKVSAEVLVAVALVAASFSTLILPATAGAAPAGCYIMSSTGSFQSSTCPSSLTPESGKCYVASLSGGTIGPYNEMNCDSITVSGAASNEDFSFGNVRKDDCASDQLSKDNCGIVRLLIGVINALSALVGVVIVAVIVMAGIQYSASADDPKAVSEAKNRIKNALFALAMFAFMYAFLQWVVPGGIL